MVIAHTPLTPTLSLVFSQSVISDGAPTAMNWIAPLTTPSFITLGPATFTQLALISPNPAALACFSSSLSRSITINGRKATPYCWAMVTSLCSARAGTTIKASNKPYRTFRADNMICLLGDGFFAATGCGDSARLRLRGRLHRNRSHRQHTLDRRDRIDHRRLYRAVDIDQRVR